MLVDIFRCNWAGMNWLAIALVMNELANVAAASLQKASRDDVPNRGRITDDYPSDALVRAS